MEGKKIVGKRGGRRKVSEPRIHVSFYGSTLKIWNDLREKLNLTHDNFTLMLYAHTQRAVCRTRMIKLLIQRMIK